jgi:hypothetical protein
MLISLCFRLCVWGWFLFLLTASCYLLSLCTVVGENAGRQIAIYSAPSSGVEYWIHSPAWARMACPARTSSVPCWCFTCKRPRRTSVYSSNSGVCPGSSHPAGLRMWATLRRPSPLFNRPTYSSMIFGKLPAACTRLGCSMSVGTRIVSAKAASS